MLRYTSIICRDPIFYSVNRSEQVLLDAFVDTTSLPRLDVFAYAETHDSKSQVKHAYTALLAKGILAEDGMGVTTIYRQRAAVYDQQHPLLPPVDDD